MAATVYERDNCDVVDTAIIIILMKSKLLNCQFFSLMSMPICTYAYMPYIVLLKKGGVVETNAKFVSDMPCPIAGETKCPTLNSQLDK